MRPVRPNGQTGRRHDSLTYRVFTGEREPRTGLAPRARLGPRRRSSKARTGQRPRPPTLRTTPNDYSCYACTSLPIVVFRQRSQRARLTNRARHPAMAADTGRQSFPTRRSRRWSARTAPLRRRQVQRTKPTWLSTYVSSVVPFPISYAFRLVTQYTDIQISI